MGERCPEGRFASEAVGLRLQECGIDTYWKGDPRDSQDNVVALATKVYYKGWNLQHRWCRNLVMEVPSGGDIWEQLIGRTHRAGQPSPAVYVSIFQHTAALRKQLANARLSGDFIDTVTQQPQRLRGGKWLHFPDPQG